MKNLSQLQKENLSQIRLLSFDCDGVIVPEGTSLSQKGNTLTITTNPLPPQTQKLLNELKKHFLLNFTSGRSLLHLTNLLSPVLWEKTSLQAEVGLFTFLEGQVYQTQVFSLPMLEKITKIKKLLFELAQKNPHISGFEPKQLIVTIHCSRPLPELETIIKENDPENDLYHFYSGEAYDIGFKTSTKKTALLWLAQKLNLKLENIMVVGNDSNDQDLLSHVGLSVSTDPSSAQASFSTTQKDYLGGQELMSHLLKLKNPQTP